MSDKKYKEKSENKISKYVNNLKNTFVHTMLYIYI